jgi:hypothetical protein
MGNKTQRKVVFSTINIFAVQPPQESVVIFFSVHPSFYLITVNQKVTRILCTFIFQKFMKICLKIKFEICTHDKYRDFLLWLKVQFSKL